ncbi:hypothetical protein BJX62DRAFT_248971 [Aspergillus germanicus]
MIHASSCAMSCIASDKVLSDLLNQIKELRTLGVTRYVEAPQLIVFGPQSPSKATVLERISCQWFPEVPGFTIELKLRKSSTRTVKASIVPGPSRNAEETQRLRAFTPENSGTADGLPKLIRRVAECLATDNRASDDLLKIEVSALEQVELTLVDLPIPCDSSEANDRKIVTDLFEKYVEDRRSIIIPVIDTTSVLIGHSPLRLVGKFDLQWERTFFAQKLSDENRDKNEKALFSQDRWAFLPREHMGKDNIASRLNGFILQHVHKAMLSLINATNEEILSRNRKLLKLGVPRYTFQQQRGYLLGISSGFERIVKQALTGMYSDEFFRDTNEPAKLYDFRRLRAVVWQLNEHFADAMLTRGSRRHIIESKPVLGDLFQDQAKPWKESAKMHMLNVWEAARYFVSLALRHLAASHTYASILRTIVAPELDILKQKLPEKLDELTAHFRRSPPLPLGKAFLIKKQQDSSDRMKAYYESTLMIFINNIVVLGIENCILEPLERIPTCQTINNMEDDQIQRIETEPDHLAGEREDLSKGIEKLQAGLRVLSLSKPMEPSWANVPVFETSQRPSENATKVAEDTTGKKLECRTTMPASKPQGEYLAHKVTRHV